MLKVRYVDGGRRWFTQRERHGVFDNAYDLHVHANRIGMDAFTQHPSYREITPYESLVDNRDRRRARLVAQREVAADQQWHTERLEEARRYIVEVDRLLSGRLQAAHSHRARPDTAAQRRVARQARGFHSCQALEAREQFLVKGGKRRLAQSAAPCIERHQQHTFMAESGIQGLKVS